MASGVEITGFEEIKKALERKIGRSAMISASREFSTTVGKYGKEIVQNSERSYAKTGQTVKQTTYKLNRGIVGGYYVVIGWKGSRRPLVHLNELGYSRGGKFGVHRIRPRGFGKIRSTYKVVGKSALGVARRVMEAQLKK